MTYKVITNWELANKLKKMHLCDGDWKNVRSIYYISVYFLEEVMVAHIKTKNECYVKTFL